MGIWRAHHSIGNILGTVIASAFVDVDWALSFVVPASILAGLGVIVFFFLVPDPRAVGCPEPDHSGESVSLKLNYFKIQCCFL